MITSIEKKIIIMALFAGEIMMKSGAEIYRVEDTISRICKACNIPYVEVFATPSGIFLSVDRGGDSSMHTFIKRIRGGRTDLGKISMTNQLSRDFVSTDLSIDSGMEILRSIEDSPIYSLPARMLGAALSSAFFCIMFGGCLKDFLATLFIGGACYGLSILLDILETNYFIKGFICTALATTLALLARALSLGEGVGPMTIGALMLFVPGVAITNAIRDFLAGDMLSGLARTAEAIFIAVSLGAGAGVVMRLWVILGGAGI